MCDGVIKARLLVLHSIMASRDGLVALGGILQTATDAYKTSLKEQADLQERLRAEMEDRHQKHCAEMEEKMRKLNEEFTGFKESIQNKALLKFSLLDIAGVWFESASKRRVRVTEGGDCIFDNSETKTVSVESNGAVKLSDGFVLSMQASSQKRLVWEKAGETLYWSYEMPGGSRRVALSLDLHNVIEGERALYSYKFSLIGCEVQLTFGRRGENPDQEGNKNLGVYFGLVTSTSRVGESTNNVDAITCRAQADLWSPKEKKWINLLRTGIRRFEAAKVGEGVFGTHSAMTLARLKEILTSTDGYGHGRLQSAKVRVTITDIGLLELSNQREIRPDHYY